MENCMWVLHNVIADIEITRQQFTAGRSNHADIICRSVNVSRRHAIFTVREDGTLHVKDNGSRNGTFVNRQVIAANIPHELHVNDEVGLGVHGQIDVINDPLIRQYIYHVRRKEPGIVVNDDPPAAPNNSVAVVNNSSTVVNNPSTVVNNPSAVVNNPSAVVNNPSAVPNNPPAVPNNTLAVVNNPPAVVNTPPAVVNNPPAAVKDDPPSALNNPPVAVSGNFPVVINGNVPAEINDNSTTAADLPQGADDGLTSQELLNILQSIDSIQEFYDSNDNVIANTNSGSTLVVEQKKAQSVTRSRTCKSNSSVAADTNAKDSISMPSTSRESRSVNAENNILHAAKDEEELELVTGKSRSSMTNQNGVAIHVKQEPFAINSSHDNRYTIEDGCIVIDDDDDDFPCSQLLENSNDNLNSNEPEGVNDSIFCAIKLEVEELDRITDGALLNPIVVDSDTDANQDWLSALREDLEIPDDRLEVESNNCIDPIPNKVAKKDVTNNEKPSSSSNGWIAKNKYVKPPVVEPHFEVKPRSSRKNGDGLLGKRKSITEENNKTKKIKTNHSCELNKKSLGHPQNDSAAKETKENRREIRKKRLKEVTEKNKNDQVTKTAKLKTTVAAAKVKVSKGRGSFLIEDLAVPSTSKAVDPRLASSAARRGKASNLRKMNPIPKLSRQESVDSNGAGQMEVNRNVVLEDNNEMQQLRQQSSNIVTNGVRQNHAERIHTSANIRHLPVNFKEVEDILLRMMSWNTKWFEEKQKNEKLGLPPVNKEPLKRMAKSFRSYGEYSKVVLPLMMADLWYFLFKEIGNMQNDPRKQCFLAMIEGESRSRNYEILDCYTYITKQQYEEYQHVKEEDVLLVQYCFQDGGQVFTNLNLGYVPQVNKKVLEGQDLVDPDFADCFNGSTYGVVNFRVMMKPSKGVMLTNRCIKVKVVTSAVSTLRIFKSVKHLEHSDLCPHVLKPSIELYKLPRVLSKKLFSKDNLNEIQLKAVMEASAICTREKPGIYLIQGPPGTGKTTVIVNIIQQILFSDTANSRCILVVAPSNGAVDELVSRFIALKAKVNPEHRKQLKLIRIGPKTSVNPMVQHYLLSELAKQNVVQELSRNAPAEYKKYIDKLSQEVSSLKHKTSPKAQARLAAVSRELEKQVKKLMGRSYHDEIKKFEESLLNGAKIICTTLSSCVGVRMTEVFQETSKKITCCIVDEATQSNEQESLIPLKLGINRMVLVGDPKQLPAVTLAREAKDCGFGLSLFSRIMKNFQDKGRNNPIRMLNVQYRMHPEICWYPNKEFYNSLLKNAPSVAERRSPLNVLVPYRVFNCDLEFSNSQEYRSRSEIDCVLKLVDAIVKKIESSCSFTIGIITPYNNQKNAISDKLKSRTFRPNIAINVNTVDSFQGQEKDIIIMSCVRVYSNNFIRDEHRLNVALTRAKHALYIIGSENLFKTCEVLGKVYDDAVKRRLVVNIKTNLPVDRLSAFLCR